MTEFKITGTFEVIFEEEDEENAVEQCMDNYLEAISLDCDDNFKSVIFYVDDVEEV